MKEKQELPEGWKKTTLGEICEIFDNKRIPLNSEQRNQRISNKSSDELFPYYGATGEVGKIDDFIFDGEFVLLGEDAAPFFEPTKNVAYIAKGKFWVNNHAHILSSLILENSYICHYLNQFNFSGYVSGTTRLKLSQGAMKKIPFVYPTNKETQQSIVNKIENLFTEIDAGIGCLKNAQQQLVQYRQALLKNAFNGELTKAWREQNAEILPSAEELLTQIQTAREQHYAEQLKQWESAVKKWELSGKVGKKPSKPKAPTQAVKFEEGFTDLPKGWGMVRLENLATESVLGKMLDKNKNKGKDRSYLGNINVRWGSFEFSETKTMKIEDDEIERYSLKYGDLVICEGGEPGRCAVWKYNTEMFIQKALHRVRFSECYFGEFAFYYLSYAVKLPLVTDLFTGTTIKHLTGTALSKILFPICSPAEQTQIVAILEQKLTACDQLATELATQLKQAELLKQAVLKAAFSGRL